MASRLGGIGRGHFAQYGMSDIAVKHFNVLLEIAQIAALSPQSTGGWNEGRARTQSSSSVDRVDSEGSGCGRGQGESQGGTNEKGAQLEERGGGGNRMLKTSAATDCDIALTGAFGGKEDRWRLDIQSTRNDSTILNDPE